MKLLLLLMILTTAMHCCQAQILRGRVTEKDTKLPVSSALISLGGKQAISNSFGEFTIEIAGAKDSLRVVMFGYKTQKLAIVPGLSIVHIELEQAKIVLNEVIVRSNRELDFKRDSAANRTFYSGQFNYTGPRVIDAFVGKPVRSSAELVTIDVFTLVRALTKKSTPEYKFHQTLLRDEQADYVNHRFNHGIVSRLTGLKGDTLSAFMVKYRPDYKFAHQSTDYEIELYIKDCYRKFVKEGMKVDTLFMR